MGVMATGALAGSVTTIVFKTGWSAVGSVISAEFEGGLLTPKELTVMVEMVYVRPGMSPVASVAGVVVLNTKGSSAPASIIPSQTLLHMQSKHRPADMCSLLAQLTSCYGETCQLKHVHHSTSLRPCPDKCRRA